MSGQKQGAACARSETAERLARRFHEAYERLAPSFGYETRADTKAFDPESPNGRLMIAVCASVQAKPQAEGAVDQAWVEEAGRLAELIARAHKMAGLRAGQPARRFNVEADAYRAALRTHLSTPNTGGDKT
jgi:hypothetical protein